MDFDFSVSKSFKTVKDEIVIVIIVQLEGELHLFVFFRFLSLPENKRGERKWSNPQNTWSIWGELLTFQQKIKIKNEIKKNIAVAKLKNPRGRVEWPAKSNFSLCVFTRVAIVGGKCIVSAPGSPLCYGSSVTHYLVVWCTLCMAAKKNENHRITWWHTEKLHISLQHCTFWLIKGLNKIKGHAVAFGL